MNCQIFSEIEPIQRVIVHNPGSEHNWVTPNNIRPFHQINGEIIENSEYLLFDDILDIDLAIRQHDTFKRILTLYNPNCIIELTDCLEHIFENEVIREDFIEIYFDNEYLNHIKSLDVSELIDVILTGYLPLKSQSINKPLPNLLFTRDIAVVIGKKIILTYSKFQARRNEYLISKFIFMYHPMFKEVDIIDFRELSNGLSLEGGDVFIVNNEILAIGISERTPRQSIEIIKSIVFEEGFRIIIGIDLPKKRSMMHLDTIFTIIDTDKAIVFDHDMQKVNDLPIYISEKASNSSLQRISSNFFETLSKYGVGLDIVKCGGSDYKNQLKEQWTDGANSFALESGKIILYNCNKHTINELKAIGYRHIPETMIDENPLEFEKYLHGNYKIVISFSGSELVKGRGGPRCMTLPIKRKVL